MFGPVFQRELRCASRRLWLHVFRGAYAGWVLATFGLFLAFYLVGAPDGARAPAAVFVLFFQVMVAQQLLVPLLLLPAFAAAGFTEEKTRGTLADLLTTGLTSAEVVGGKVLAEAVRAAYLFLAGWPMVGFAAALVGLEPGSVLALVACGLAPLPALAAAGLLAAVWCRRTGNAVLAAYALLAAGVAVLWGLTSLADILGPLHFLRLLEDNPDAGQLARIVAFTWAAWGGLALAYLAVAMWRFRPACLRQLAAAVPRGQAVRGWIGRPPISDAPLLWKGQYVDGFVGVAVLRRLPPGLDVAAVAAVAVVGSAAALLLVPSADVGFAVLGLVMLFLASLAVGVRASTAVSGEREQQTWESLLLTPLTARQILRGKVWGILHASRSYLQAYFLPALVLSLLGGPAAVGWTLLCWVLTWAAMYFLGATGLVYSLRSDSSWKSLLGALAWSYVFFTARFVFVGLPFGCLVAVAIFVVGQFFAPFPALAPWLGHVFFWGACLGTGILIFARAEQLLEEAERRLASTDRIPQGPRRRPESRWIRV